MRSMKTPLALQLAHPKVWVGLEYSFVLSIYLAIPTVLSFMYAGVWVWRAAALQPLGWT